MNPIIAFLQWLIYTLGIASRPTTPGPAPEPKPPTSPITGNELFRSLPAISEARFCEILKNYPMEGECRAIYAAAKGDPLPLAQSWMESNYGGSDNARRTHNPLGLLFNETTPGKPYLDVGANGVTVRLLQFATWAGAFTEWRRRVDDPNYKGGVYRNLTLRQFIYTFVGGPRCLSHGECGNGETRASCEHYFQETVKRLNRYYKVAPGPVPVSDFVAHELAGSSQPLVLPRRIPFRQQITTITPNRTHKKRTGKFCTVQHTTNNPRVGADAGDHAQWQQNGTPGHPNGKVSVHFYVDDEEIVQTLPFDEKGIHSGDWRNDSCVAAERTTDTGNDTAKANDHAAWLQAGLLRIGGTNAHDAMYPHTFNAEGHCPALGMPWAEYEDAVDERLAKVP